MKTMHRRNVRQQLSFTVIEGSARIHVEIRPQHNRTAAMTVRVNGAGSLQRIATLFEDGTDNGFESLWEPSGPYTDYDLGSALLGTRMAIDEAITRSYVVARALTRRSLERAKAEAMRPPNRWDEWR